MKKLTKFKKHGEEIEEFKKKVAPAGKKRKRSLRYDQVPDTRKKYRNYFEEE